MDEPKADNNNSVATKDFSASIEEGDGGYGPKQGDLKVIKSLDYKDQMRPAEANTATYRRRNRRTSRRGC